MSQFTVTVIDTAGIQGYIFDSNVLRENIGASELVRRATRLWPLEQIQEVGATNVKPKEGLTGDAEDLDETKHIEDGSLDAEVVYAGGGNCVILFRDSKVARKFVTQLSKLVLEEAPGLNLVAAHVDMTWEKHALADKVHEALDRLAVKKLNRRVSTPLLGLGTTAACRSTGLPAVGTDADEPGLKPARAKARPLSADILAKLRYVDEANHYLKRLLPSFTDPNLTLDIPYDFDHFGRETGEISYIAVVHADGNGMGQRIEELRQRYARPEDNRAYIEAMRSFSTAVETASRQALDRLSALLLRHWDPSKEVFVGKIRQDGGQLQHVGTPVQMKQGRYGTYVPFRPIVFGGDDLTFVTDGRLGLGLAAAYLDLFEKAMNAQDNEYTRDLLAGAGVSVVKAHYPFARAYALSEELAGNAKRAWNREFSALDWHFAATGLFGRLGEIRDRQYTVPSGCLAMRPLPVHEGHHPWRSWPGFARAAKEFLTSDEWEDRRNKVIALRQVLREGPDAVKRFRTAYRLNKLPALSPRVDSLQETGWEAGLCGHFDVIEALDFFLPLEG